MAGLGTNIFASADVDAGSLMASASTGADAIYGPPSSAQGSRHPLHPRNFPGFWVSAGALAALVLIRWSLPR
jgi:hypothetical protein